MREIPMQRRLRLATGLLAGAGLAAASWGCGPAQDEGPVPLGGPVDMARAAARSAAAEPRDTGAATLAWTVPEGWTELTPSSAMRKAQYRVPGPGGDAECVVFYFGPGQGGDAGANARRWVGQFNAPDGGPAGSAAKVTERDVGGIGVTLVEVSGTYVGGMGPAMGGGEPRPGQMLLGAIAPGPGANWFFKLLGPEETVDASRDAFLALIDSLRVQPEP